MLKNIYTKRFFWKILFLTLGLIIALSSLYYSHNIVQKLADEEEKKVKLVAKAWRELADVNSTADISFLLDIIKNPIKNKIFMDYSSTICRKYCFNDLFN